MRKIKRDDTVILIAGKDRGKTGVVRQIVGGGDLVRVVECRPMSRSKRWRVVEILERAK